MEGQNLFSKLISTNTDVQTEVKIPKGIIPWSHDMEGHAPKSVERFLRSGAQGG